MQSAPNPESKVPPRGNVWSPGFSRQDARTYDKQEKLSRAWVWRRFCRL